MARLVELEIGQHRAEAEHGRERVLLLAHPGHRLDHHRVQGKDRRCQQRPGILSRVSIKYNNTTDVMCHSRVTSVITQN